MSNQCSEYAEVLADLAEGKTLPHAQAHVERCLDCNRIVFELRSIIEVARASGVVAPADVVNRAIAIMKPLAKPSFVAKLLRSSFATGGARNLSRDFQLQVEADGVPMRFSYNQSGGQWSVLGRVPLEFDLVMHHKGEQWPDENGGFQFRVLNLNETAFDLVSSDRVIHVPAATDLSPGL